MPRYDPRKEILADLEIDGEKDIGEMDRFEGWTNRDTWMVAQWTVKDYDLSRKIRNFVDQWRYDDVESLARLLETFVYEKTPSGAAFVDQLDDPDSVNYFEIAESWVKMLTDEARTERWERDKNWRKEFEEIWKGEKDWVDYV